MVWVVEVAVLVRLDEDREEKELEGDEVDNEDIGELEELVVKIDEELEEEEVELIELVVDKVLLTPIDRTAPAATTIITMTTTATRILEIARFCLL